MLFSIDISRIPQSALIKLNNLDSSSSEFKELAQEYLCPEDYAELEKNGFSLLADEISELNIQTDFRKTGENNNSSDSIFDEQTTDSVIDFKIDSLEVDDALNYATDETELDEAAIIDNFLSDAQNKKLFDVDDDDYISEKERELTEKLLKGFNGKDSETISDGIGNFISLFDEDENGKLSSLETINAKKLLKVIDGNEDEFSEEDLQVLLDFISEINADGDMTEEEILNAIKSLDGENELSIEDFRKINNNDNKEEEEEKETKKTRSSGGGSGSANVLDINNVAKTTEETTTPSIDAQLNALSESTSVVKSLGDKNSNEMTTDDINSMSGLNSDQKSRLNEALEKTNATKGEVDSTKEKLPEGVQEITQNYQTSTEEYSNAQEDVNDLTQQQAAIQTEQDSWSAAAIQTQTNIDTLNTKYNSITIPEPQYAEDGKTITNQTAIDQANAQRAAIQAQIEAQKAVLEEQNAKVEDLKSQIETIGTALETANTTLNDKKTTLNEAKSAYDEVLEQNKETMEEFDKAMADYSTALEKYKTVKNGVMQEVNNGNQNAKTAISQTEKQEVDDFTTKVDNKDTATLNYGKIYLQAQESGDLKTFIENNKDIISQFKTVDNFYQYLARAGYDTSTLLSDEAKEVNKALINSETYYTLNQKLTSKFGADYELSEISDEDIQAIITEIKADSTLSDTQKTVLQSVLKAEFYAQKNGKIPTKGLSVTSKAAAETTLQNLGVSTNNLVVTENSDGSYTAIEKDSNGTYENTYTMDSSGELIEYKSSLGEFKLNSNGTISYTTSGIENQTITLQTSDIGSIISQIKSSSADGILAKYMSYFSEDSNMAQQDYCVIYTYNVCATQGINIGGYYSQDVKNNNATVSYSQTGSGDVYCNGRRHIGMVAFKYTDSSGKQYVVTLDHCATGIHINNKEAKGSFLYYNTFRT